MEASGTDDLNIAGSNLLLNLYFLGGYFTSLEGLGSNLPDNSTLMFGCIRSHPSTKVRTFQVTLSQGLVVVLTFVTIQVVSGWVAPLA